jgi:hypothetical protein
MFTHGCEPAWRSTMIILSVCLTVYLAFGCFLMGHVFTRSVYEGKTYGDACEISVITCFLWFFMVMSDTYKSYTFRSRSFGNALKDSWSNFMHLLELEWYFPTKKSYSIICSYGGADENF